MICLLTNFKLIFFHCKPIWAIQQINNKKTQNVKRHKQDKNDRSKHLYVFFVRIVQLPVKNLIQPMLKEN